KHCAQMFLTAGYWRIPDEKLEDQYIARFNSVANRRQTLLDINNGKPVNGSLWHSAKNIQRLDRWKLALTSLVRPLTTAAAVIIAVGTLIGLAGIRRRIFPTPWYILSAILLSNIAARMAIFALYEETGVTVQDRYMFPLIAPLAILAVL